jgi:zinc transport system permease protein
VGEFLTAVSHHSFLQLALLAGVLASVGCGVVGSYVVVMRIGYLAGGIAHAVLGGMGIAWFLGAAPVLGALVAAVLSALLIGWVSLRYKEREDTLIGAVWATGMAIGILFISKTPGYNTDLMSYLFGNILMVTAGDVARMAVLDVIVLGVVAAMYRAFLAVAFDEEFAKVRGLPSDAIHLVLLTIVALTVVLLIQVVGLILVIALLTLPAATAGLLTHSMARMMALAAALGATFTTAGLALSYGPDLPSGATTILLAAAAYIAVALVKGWRTRRKGRALAAR